MEIKVFLDSAEVSKILSEAWNERDTFTALYPRHQRVRHLLRLKIKERIEKALDDAAYEIAGGIGGTRDL